MFHIILFTPQIPPNTGNIIRLSANTGTQLHLIEPLGFQLDAKSCRRAGLDYHALANVHLHKNLDECSKILGPARLFAITSLGTKSLFDQKLISQQELEQVEASYQIAVSQAEQANANLLSAEDELSKTRLTAPKYGIVTSITKEEGEMAVGGMFNPGVLMTIADLSRMEVEVDVNENDVVNIIVGDTTEIEIDAYPDTMFYGVVSEIAHTAQSLNMGSQQQVTNFKVKVRMITVPDKIRPGMSSTVNILTETIKNTISIPIQALTSRPENFKDVQDPIKKNKKNKWNDSDDISFKKIKPIDVVFTLKDEFEDKVAEEGKKYAIARPTKVGISGENYYAVKSGVNEGEMIVIGGYRVLSKELSHGDLVIVKNQTKDSGGEGYSNITQ